jgi:EAL domain-containing protein (putative c-di-GMP-specific phosphodiesterase class I)
MYRAKREKTGLSVFDEAQRRQALGRLDTEQQLRIALEDSKLDVHYQPIVDSRDRSIAAMEALVRWNRPGKGFVAPGSFLDVAEESGLIAPLGELVLREAVAQTSIWNHGILSGRQVKVGVNVAERQLIDPLFVSKVEKVLEWAALPPWLLTLEITEDVIMEHLDSSLSVLRDVKRMGVNLAIDDFGTGRSSLSYVRRLDMVDVLKIDKSFVDGLGQDSVDEAIVQAIAAMATALGLEMVAEGVETELQFDILKSLGVHRVQGFLFHRPVPASELEYELRHDNRLVPPPDALGPAPAEVEHFEYQPGMASPFTS